MYSAIRQFFDELHQDDAGGQEVSMMLLIIFIALPILIILVAFRKKLKEYVESRWGQLTSEDGGTGSSGGGEGNDNMYDSMQRRYEEGRSN